MSSGVVSLSWSSVFVNNLVAQEIYVFTYLLCSKLLYFVNFLGLLKAFVMEENLCLSEDLHFSSIRVEMDDFFTVTQYFFPLLSFPEYMPTWKQTHLKNRCCYKFLWFSVTIIFPTSSSADLHEFCANYNKGQRLSCVLQRVPAQQELHPCKAVSDPWWLHYRHFLNLHKWVCSLS